MHEALKLKLLEVEGPLEFGNGESRARRPYYLKRLEDNLAVTMLGRMTIDFHYWAIGILSIAFGALVWWVLLQCVLPEMESLLAEII